MTRREALPPRAAEWLLERALPPAEGRCEIAEDFRELFAHRLRERGVLSARLWYWKQVAISFGAQVFFGGRRGSRRTRFARTSSMCSEASAGPRALQRWGSWRPFLSRTSTSTCLAKSRSSDEALLGAMDRRARSLSSSLVTACGSSALAASPMSLANASSSKEEA